MSNQVLLKKSSVAAKVPQTGDLQYGEVALNYADGKLYFKNSSNTIQPLGISYTKVVANTTALINQGYIANTGAGSFTITLPASPQTGNYVIIADDNSFYANNLYVARNGSTIAGINQDLTLDIQGVTATLLYNGGTWQVYTQVGATGGTAGLGSSSNVNYDSFSSSIIPDTNNSYQLGNATYGWKSLYFADGTSQATAANADGTSITNSSGTITAQAGGLAGTTLKSTVVYSSLTSVGTITTGVWQGTAIANNKLANSSVTLNGSSVSLGGSLSINTLVNGSFTTTLTSSGQLQLPVITQGSTTGGVLVAAGNVLLNANGNIWNFGSDGTLTSPYSVKFLTTGLSFPGSTSGTIAVQAAAIAGTNTITLPATTGTVVTTGDTGTVTNTMLAGSIATSKITGLATSATTDTTNASNITSGTLPNARLSSVPNSALANSTISGVSLGSNLNTLTFGTGLTGTSYNGSGAVTIALDTTAVKNLFSVTSNSAGTEALSYSGGVFTFTPYALPTATTSTLGGVTVDGSTITISGSTISAPSFQPNGVYNITSSGGTTTLTASTAINITVTGSSSQTIKLPDATTLKSGWIFRINNNTSSASSLTVQDASGTTVGTVPQGGDSQVILLTNSTAAGSWDVHGWIPSNILMGSSVLQLGSSSYSIGPYNSSLTIGSASSVSTTYNFGTGATTSGNTKSINIGTAGVSGSTTTITLGSNVSGATSSTVVNGQLSVTTSGSSGSITVTDTGTNGSNIALVGNGSTTPNKYLRSYNGSFGIVNSGYTASIINISDAGMISTGGASSATSNIPTSNAISLNSNGYLSDDGNFHITSSSGSIWINPVDSSAVRIGTQYNSGSGAGLIVQGGITSNTTDPSQGTYFPKVQTNWNVNQPSLIMDNLNVRLRNTSGNSLIIEASAVSGSFSAYITTCEMVAGASIGSQTNSSGITFTAGTWTSVNAIHTLSSGGDVIVFHVMDSTTGKIYRVTCIHTNGSTNGSIFIERMV